MLLIFRRHPSENSTKHQPSSDQIQGSYGSELGQEEGSHPNLKTSTFQMNVSAHSLFAVIHS